MHTTTLTAAAEQVLSHVLLAQDSRPLKALKDFLTLHTPAVLASYPPTSLLADWKQALGKEQLLVLPPEIAPKATGDPERIALCLQIFLDNLRLGPDTVLELRLTEQRHTVGMAPCLQCTFLGPGLVPPVLLLEQVLSLTLADFSDCWTRATRDGRIDVTPEGATLWLQGARPAPVAIPEAEVLLALLDSQGGPSGAAEALAFIDGQDQPLAGSLPRNVQEALAQREGELAGAGIRVEIEAPGDLPQLLLRRRRIQALGQALCDFTLWHVRAGAQLRIVLRHAPEQREVELQVTVQAEQAEMQETFHLASMQRAAADHSSTLEALVDAEEAVFTLAFPDEVARRLDAWLPGWEQFAPRCQQMLRLLKSGGQTPPEQFILEGVLEEELERRLLPRLEMPLAKNLAKELEPGAAKNAFAMAERASKALGQIARGKPKKEIAQPVYAAEIIHAFGGNARGTFALGLQHTDTVAQDALKKALTSTPVEAHEALLIVTGWPVVGSDH